MQELHDLSKPFKYVVSCVIVQKNGAGFHIGHSAYWDISNDNVCQVRAFPIFRWACFIRTEILIGFSFTVEMLAVRLARK